MIHNSFSFVFFGTPEPAVEILDILKQHNMVPALVVTNPDKPKGRHLKPASSPVKLWAIKNKIPDLQQEKLDSAFYSTLNAKRYTLFIVVAYGAILPKKVLDIPEYGALNIHYSLLPKYRGASPIESQIMADDRNIGVSIILLDEEMDHGPIVAQQRLIIQDSRFKIHDGLVWPPSAIALRKIYNEVAGKLLAETIPKFVAGEIQAVPQDHGKATYTKKFTKADGEINLADDAHQNFLKIRAFEGSIGTYFYFPSSHSPFRGEVQIPRGIVITPKGIRVLIKSAEFKGGKLNILRVIPEGKREMSYEEFLRGLK